MSRDTINRICAAFPAAEWSDPWGGGHDAWKVGGRMFACIGAVDDGVSVKTADAETAAMLIDAGVGSKAPYLHSSWIRLALDASDDEMHARLGISYDLIRAGLTKKLQRALPPRAAPAD